MKTSLKQKLITSTCQLVMTTGFLTAISFSSAHAIEMLTPVTGWSLSKVTTQDTPEPYCVLSRKYDRNVILSVAENVEEKVTFAFDLQSPNLNPEQDYDIEIMVGGDFNQKFTIAPATQSAFVFRVDEAEFKKALWSAEQIEISVNRDRFSFSTRGFTDGQSRLDQCLDVLRHSASGSPIKSAPEDGGQPSPSKKAQLQSDQPSDYSAPAHQTADESAKPVTKVPRSILNEMDRLREINQNLQQSIHEEEQGAEEYKSSENTLRKQFLLEKQKLRIKINELQRKNQKLQQMTVTADQYENAKNKLNQYALEMKRLEEEKGQLKEKLSEEQQLADKIAQLQRKNAELQQVAKKVGNFAEAQNTLDQLESDLKQVKQEKSSLEQQLLAQSQETENLAEKQREISQLKRKNRQMEQELQTLQKVKAQLKQETKVEAQQVAELQSRLDKLLLENNRLQDQLEEQKLASAKKIAPEQNAQQLAQISSLKTQIDQLESENQTLNQRLAKVDRVTSQQQQAEKNNLQTRISALENELNQVLSEKKSLQETIKNIQNENTNPTVQASLKDPNTRSLQQRYTEAKQEIRRMAVLIKEQRAEFEREKQELENLLFDPAVAEREQIAYLKELEQELQITNQALEEQRQMYENKLARASKTPPEQVKSTEDNTAQLNDISPTSSQDDSIQRSMSQEIERLREISAQLRQSEAKNLTQIQDPPRSTDQKSLNGKTVTAELSQIDTKNPDVLSEPASNETVRPADQTADPVSMKDASVNLTEPVIQAIADAIAPPASTLVSHKITENLGRALPSEEMISGLRDIIQDIGIDRQNKGDVIWNTRQLRGGLVSYPIQKGSFDKSINQILTAVKQTCEDQIDIEPTLLRKNHHHHLYVYDATCGKDIYSFIFFAENTEKFSSIIFEGSSSDEKTISSHKDLVIEKLMSNFSQDAYTPNFSKVENHDAL